jgi:hypothetical protein
MPRPWSLLDPCVPVHLPAAFFRYCVSRGVQASDLLQGVGLPARVLDRPQTQLSYAQVRQLVENALKHTGDPALGLKFGLQIRLSHLGPYGVALLSAPTLRDAMTVVGRFHTLLGPAMRLMPEIGSRQVAIEVSKAIPMGSIHVFNQEVLVSGTLRILRTLLERELRGLRVAFDYARPAHGAQCSLLSAPVRWNQARCTVTFDAEGVDRRLPGADDAAHDAATRQ